MILIPYTECPICSRAGRTTKWTEINHNAMWWEKMCQYFHKGCGFTQHYFDSFDSLELKYIQFRLQDFRAYTYSDKYPEIQPVRLGDIIPGATYFYPNVFPRGRSVQSPFQIWHNFVPDWDNLDKLNKKLKLLSTFS